MKKQPKDQPVKNDIEARVDAMMAVNEDAPAKPAVPPAEAPPEPLSDTTPATQPIDIFAESSLPIDEAPGAPPVPGAKPVKHAAPQSTTTPTENAKIEAEMPIEPVDEPTVDATPTLPDDVAVKDIQLDTPQTDEAIADIVAQEGDEVLAAQDAGIERAIETADVTAAEPPAKSGHPIFWFFVALLVAVAAAAAYVLSSPGLGLPFGL